MKFRIYHQAPDGPKMYHIDSFCNLSQDSNLAKVYGNKNTTEEIVQRQLKLVRESFEQAFNTAGTENGFMKLEYRTAEHWMGCGLDKIETKTENI